MTFLTNRVTLLLLLALPRAANAFSSYAAAPVFGVNTAASPQDKNILQAYDHDFDLARIRNGQRFFQENCVAISMTWYCSLIASFSTPEPAEALLQTGESDTGLKAERRYMQRTIPALLSWHSEDLLDPNSRATKFLRMVNGKHTAAAAQQPNSPTASKCPFSRATRRFVARHDNLQLDAGRMVGGESGAFSHGHMAATQMAFVAGAVLCSEAFGVSSSSQGLEDFVYLWFVLGKVLGLKDEHNSCKSLEEAKKAAQDLTTNLSSSLSESLRTKDQRFQKLTQAFLEGTNQRLPFDVPAPVAMKLTIESLGLQLEDAEEMVPQLKGKDQILYNAFRLAMVRIGQFPVWLRFGIYKLQQKLFLR